MLSPEERDLGAIVIDIGGGSTNVALFAGNSVKHTPSLDVGGNHITNDLAFGLHVAVPEAERLKKAHGCAFSHSVESYEMVELRSLGEREPQKRPRQDLCDIIEPRVDEMLQMVREEIIQSGYAKGMAGGIVLTGGTAMLPGIVRVGRRPLSSSGALWHPHGHWWTGGYGESSSVRHRRGLVAVWRTASCYGHVQKFANGHLFGKTYHRMRDWFREFLA